MKTVQNIRTNLKGCSFHDRTRSLLRLRQVPESQCSLVPEPDCQFDPNAVRVEAHMDGTTHVLGYLDRTSAKRITNAINKKLPVSLDRVIPIGGWENRHTGCIVDITWIEFD